MNKYENNYAKARRFTIKNDFDVSHAVYSTLALAKEAGFNPTLQTMIATAVSELAMNIVKYAHNGKITIAVILQMNQTGIEIVAEDKGPGIADRVSALQDNVSMGNTLGVGLPGVKRLMDEFLMDTHAGLGTKIVARKWSPK